jgi:hypothetical protein
LPLSYARPAKWIPGQQYRTLGPFSLPPTDSSFANILSKMIFLLRAYHMIEKQLENCFEGGFTYGYL